MIELNELMACNVLNNYNDFEVDYINKLTRTDPLNFTKSKIGLSNQPDPNLEAPIYPYIATSTDPPPVPNCKVSTLNLSKRPLSQDESNLLNKGLTFVPTQTRLPISTIIKNRNRLLRSLKLRAFFQNKDREDCPNPLNKLFRNPSVWCPPDHELPPPVLTLIDNLKLSCAKMINKYITNNNNSNTITTPSNKNTNNNNKTSKYIINLKIKSNLKTSERKALSDLRRDLGIIIKPVDKGSNTCILDRDAYIYEGETQLADKKYYKKIDKPIYYENIPKIKKVLYKLLQQDIISKEQFEYLTGPPNPGPRVFYLLPKIHKRPQDWRIPNILPKGRPIVADSASESCRVAEFIDFFINPLAQKHRTYVKNTYDFIDKIRGMTVPDNCFLITGDIESLYTNMDIDRCIEVVRQTLLKQPAFFRPDTEILELLEISMKNNDFIFNNQYYLQILGCAMGKKFAPALANLYLLDFDDAALDVFQDPKLPFLFRYLDDIFTLFIGPRERIPALQDFLSNLLPNIKITLEFNSQEINFLDTTIFIKDNKLHTKVYFKETDSHELLHHNSAHPKHTFKGLLKSQLIRFKRLSSFKEDYDQTCKILFSTLKGRGYSLRTMTDLQHRIWFDIPDIKRNNKIFNKLIQNPKEIEKTEILPIITNNDPLSIDISKKFRNIIEESNLFPDTKLITAYTVTDSLQDILVRSKLAPPIKFNKTNNTDLKETAE